jgi:cysteine desulfurase/selenocysteine lyase
MADGQSLKRPFDIQSIRSEFPVLSREVNGKPLIYLDSAASSQKPLAVIDCMSNQMKTAYANVHRGLHTLANETTAAMESAREDVRRFLNAAEVEEIIFTKGATEGINLVAKGRAPDRRPGDEIIFAVMEHHSNIIPWHFLRERYGAVLKWIPILEDGSLDMDAYEAALSNKSRLVAITAMSNVLGTVTDAERIVELAHGAGARVLLDGCQATVHKQIDVRHLNADFFVFSPHKLYGPTGVGVLYGKRAALEAIRPYQGGGEMIASVTMDAVSYAEIPHKFEAGTPPILEAIALGAAVRWIESFDRNKVHAHETGLYNAAYKALASVNSIRIHGTAPGKGSVLSFSVDGVHPHDLAQILDKYGVAIRAGHHCAQPLMTHLGVSATARASFGIYNTLEEVDAFSEALQKALRMLG